MTDTTRIGRRRWLQRALGAASGLALSACNKLAQSQGVNSTLESAEGLTRGVQRLLLGRHALAPEYSASDISTAFRANGTIDPGTDEYNQHVQAGFADWRLKVSGLVENPLELSLADLRRIASRTQITRHDCVEGWSCIGEWKGAPLAHILALAKPKPQSRYVVFYCADPMGQADVDAQGNLIPAPFYYESLDLLEATHPQTILAYELNGQVLPVEHGAPIRVRAERQLGYKMPKYVQRIELVDSFARIGGGKGGYWEDQGYQWYGGI